MPGPAAAGIAAATRTIKTVTDAAFFQVQGVLVEEDVDQPVAVARVLHLRAVLQA